MFTIQRTRTLGTSLLQVMYYSGRHGHLYRAIATVIGRLRRWDRAKRKVYITCERFFQKSVCRSKEINALVSSVPSSN